MTSKSKTKEGVIPEKRPTLLFYRSESNRVLFVRLFEDDKDDDALVSLYRLLETENIDTIKAMEKWNKIRCLTLPAWVERKLREHYDLVELKSEQWLAGE